MMTKYYVNAAGAYIGAYVGAEPPAGAIEVAVPPSRGSDIWGVEAFVSGGQEYFAASDRNFGLQIFRDTGLE